MDVWPLPRICFRELSSVHESRPAALITHPAAWTSVEKSLQLPVIIRAEPNRDDQDFYEYLAGNLPSQAEVIYGVGEDQTLDAAKVVANRNKKPLVLVPTALSSDVPFTATASVRDGAGPGEIVTGPADDVIVDMNVIKAAPPAHRAAGIADVLSIVTALRDWTYAEQKGKNTADTRIVQWATGIAASLAAQAIKTAAAMGKGDSDALHSLIDLMCLTLQLESQLGHRRVSHGLEHIFAAAVKADPSVIHAEKVGAGILLASALYGKDALSMRAALEAAGVRLDALRHEDIRGAFNTLPDFAKQHNSPFTMINDLQSYSDELIQAQNKSTLLAS